MAELNRDCNELALLDWTGTQFGCVPNELSGAECSIESSDEIRLCNEVKWSGSEKLEVETSEIILRMSGKGSIVLDG